MIPFVMQQHEKSRAEIRELQANEVGFVGGGLTADPKLNSYTVGPNGEKDDGADES